VKWLWFTYAVYWSAVALAAALALAGYHLIEPEAVKRAFNETASLPYEQRLLQSALDLLVVAVASYPGLIYAAAAYGAATAAVSEPSAWATPCGTRRWRTWCFSSSPSGAVAPPGPSVC
jgi:hypothetical protein